MQYLLTEEEYNELRIQNNAKQRECDIIINDLCQTVANHLPVHVSDPHSPIQKQEPWKCIRSVKYEWYCDNCPVKDICRWPNKVFSK